MIRVCLIEDEPEIRKLLRKIIERQEGFEVVAESGDFATTISNFAQYRPDVAFVDIDLNGESGMECARIMTSLNPEIKIIFATAHSEYMANAFELYAFDYLVKPFDVARVQRTLMRLKGESGKKQTIVEGPAEERGRSEPHRDKLMIKGREQVIFVDKDEIILLERSDHMTRIVTATEEYRTSASLGSLEEKLKGDGFIRSHKSYLINLEYIAKIEPYGRWTYVVKFKYTESWALMTARVYEEIKKRFG